MNRAARAVATLALLVTSAAGAQPPGAAPEPAAVRGASAQTRKRLLEIEQKILTGKHAEAADDLQRVLDESGSDLIPPDVNQSHPAARWIAHRLLARLNPGALRAYRDRIDPPAQLLLAEAKRTHDPQPLYQLLSRYFVSRPADEGLLLLGDLLFERGEFRAAESAWRRLLPDAGAELVYPNSKADPALVRARIVLAVIFAGEWPRATAELGTFKTKHPNATGTLAGRTGPLAATLQTFLDAKPRLAPQRPSGAWPTFGGGPERTGRVPGGVPRDWHARAAWGPKALPENPRPAALSPPARPPFGHPVIVNDEVFVASATRVFRFDLHLGDDGAPYDSGLRYGKPKELLGSPPPLPDACASLTAADGLLYARFGPPVVRAPENLSNNGPPEESFVACLRPGPRRINELWRLPPPENRKVPAVWEGAPLVAGKRLWAVYAKYEGGRVVHVAACYDPVTGEAAPKRPAWATELCDSAQPVSGEGRTRQELLTLSGRNLVFCSNSGAVVALDAATGQRAWAFRYPRSRRGASAGDPSPAVAFGGRVFVAPADGERVYCLDGVTGRVVWESGPVEGARVLGVARGRLVVSVAKPFAGLRGLNLDNGSHRREDGGWAQGAGILSYGQGFVTDDVIVWPSRAGLYFVLPETGLPAPGRPNPLPSPLLGARPYFGNVAYADGVLVVVTHSQVWGYRAEPDRIVPRPSATPTGLFHWLIDRSEREFAAGNRAAGLADLLEAATSDLPAPLRAWAAARLVQQSPRAGTRDQLPAAVRTALRPELMSEWVLTSDGLPVTLETFVRSHLGSAAQRASRAAAPEREPCAPALSPESDFDRTLKLPPGVSPLRPIAGAGGAARHLFAAGASELIAVPLDQRAETPHTAPDVFTQASDFQGGFVAVGPKAVALYGTARDPVWVFRVPVTARLADGPLPFCLPPHADPIAPYLSSFRLAGSWLLARLGDFHLIALDLGAKRVAWVLATTGDNGYEPLLFASAAKFGPHFAVAGRFAVAQLSDGRLWFVALDTGRPTPQPAVSAATALVDWPHPPAALGANRIVLADGAGRIRLVTLGALEGLPAVALPLPGAPPLLLFGNRVRWTFETERAEGLTGAPPQVRDFGGALALAVRRNHGVELECVDPANGKPLWTDPAFVDADRVDLANADADADHVYVPVGNKLRAFARADGSPAWSTPLPGTEGTEWIVRVGKSCLIVYPTRAVPREAPGAVVARLTRSFEREPQLWRLPGLAATLYDAWVDRAAPVLLLDPETGKRVGSFEVPARGPGVTAWFGPGATAFATGDRVVWLK